MNRVRSLEDLESSGAVPRLGSVEEIFERDVAALATELATRDLMGLTDTSYEVGGQTLILIDVAATGRIVGNLAIRGAVVSGQLDIHYLDDGDLGKESGCVRLAKTLMPGSTFMFTRDQPVYLSCRGPTFLLMVAPGSKEVHRLRVASILDNTPEHHLAMLSDDELLAAIDQVNFGDVAAMHEHAVSLLKVIGQRRSLLRRLLDKCATESSLRNKCECMPDMYKFVLNVSPQKDARLRLHVFRTEYEDVPHSHRWPMISYVICGTAMNKYYGSDYEVLKTYENRPPSVRICHRMTNGSAYSFDHTVIHWFHGAPGAVTLTLRGPINKDASAKFEADKLNYKFGSEAKIESDCTMTEAEFGFGCTLLRTLNLI